MIAFKLKDFVCNAKNIMYVQAGAILCGRVGLRNLGCRSRISGLKQVAFCCAVILVFRVSRKHAGHLYVINKFAFNQIL